MAAQSPGVGGGGEEKRTDSLVQLSDTNRAVAWYAGKGGIRANSGGAS